ncbi:hypothetical protein G6F66_012519 [Rhizopus arrhizus]|nr:hypothetical protein G6F66_012519 [Rhizopus arrhizus]
MDGPKLGTKGRIDIARLGTLAAQVVMESRDRNPEKPTQQPGRDFPLHLQIGVLGPKAADLAFQISGRPAGLRGQRPASTDRVNPICQRFDGHFQLAGRCGWAERLGQLHGLVLELIGVATTGDTGHKGPPSGGAVGYVAAAAQPADPPAGGTDRGAPVRAQPSPRAADSRRASAAGTGTGHRAAGGSGGGRGAARAARRAGRAAYRADPGHAAVTADSAFDPALPAAVSAGAVAAERDEHPAADRCAARWQPGPCSSIRWR